MLDYASAGPLTDLAGVPRASLDVLAHDPVEICSAVSELVIQPNDARRLGLPHDRIAAENQIRAARDLVTRLLALHPATLDIGREPSNRVVGTCRHFALLSCALLRHRGIAARARCGFATYFHPGQGVDHWVTEYRDDSAGRWIRIDSEILNRNAVARPHDLAPGQFLTGGEAWLMFRREEIDASRFGVHGTENWGPAEISGNAVRDLAALNKVEMLPWDQWGRMTDAYAGKTGPDYDQLIDTVAATCASDDPISVAELYTHEDLRVPTELLD
jgi:hypothetical protein